MSVYDDIKNSPYIKFAALVAATSGAAAIDPKEAEAQEVSYSDFVKRTQAEDEKLRLQAEATTETYWDEEEGRMVTRLVSERRVPVERGPVSNDAFHAQATLRTEVGLPILNSFSDTEGKYTRLELIPELQLWTFGADAVLNVKAMDLYVPFLNEDAENKFDIDTLKEVNFRAKIIGPLSDALLPPVLNVDNSMYAAVELKHLPESASWLPGLSTAFTVVHDGPLDTIVSLKASMHLDPDLLKEGTYLPRLAELKLQDGWYIGGTENSLQADIVGELGIRGEVVQQQPQAPLQDLDKRVSAEVFAGVHLTIRGQAPQKPEPKR